jgi:hypothetical protein
MESWPDHLPSANQKHCVSKTRIDESAILQNLVKDGESEIS